MSGTYYEESRKSYVARPTISGEKVFLGRFETKAEAELAVGLYKGKLEAAQEASIYSVKPPVVIASAMKLEETRPEKPNIFTRIKGRLKKHKVLS